MHILIVDDEQKQRELLAGFLRKKGHTATPLPSGKDAIEMNRTTGFDLAILDLKMPEIDGIETMTKMKELDPMTYFIILTGYGTVESAVEAIKLGAYDYLNKPINLDELELKIERIYEAQRAHQEIEELRNEILEDFKFESFVTQSPKMQEILSLISRIAKSNSTALILGQSGTGKEMVARLIHTASLRKNNRFIPISCAALPETLLESELFGYERGAFTGADKKKIGKFELAHQGTLFLDEIGDLPLSIQVKLLRVLQEFSFERLGSNAPIKVDVRLISATNQDLKKKIVAGTFREDLFYRLNVITVELPALKERKEDIKPLVEQFMKKFSLKHNKPIREVSKAALHQLSRYDWPGNVRELENIMERAVVLCRSGIIDTQDIAIIGQTGSSNARTDSLADVEKNHISTILNESGGNLTDASKRLGIHRNTLRLKIKEYGITKI